MIILRSVLFNFIFVLFSGIYLCLGIPLLFFKSPPLRFIYGWENVVLFLQRLIVGTKIEVRGQEHMNQGVCLYAAKHESTWETIFLHRHIKSLSSILKKELTQIPLYGHFIKSFPIVIIDRKEGAKALVSMIKQAQKRVTEGHPLLIFPEGTRTKPGDPPRYQRGILSLYERLNIPVVPVALNSGLFWGRHTFKRFPGKLIIEFLPPIPPGLSREEFMSRLSSTIEEKSQALRNEALTSSPQLAQQL